MDDVTEKIAVIRWNLKKIKAENQGEGNMQMYRDQQTIDRASEALSVLAELEQAIEAER